MTDGPATRRLGELRRELAQLDAERRVMVAQIEALEKLAAVEAEEELQTPTGHANSKRNMNMDARRHLSRAVAHDPLVAAADKAGHTLRSLASMLGCSAALLSQARRGVRSISKGLAADVERVTGFPATKKNWPKLRSE